MGRIYLDYAAATPLDERVLQAMMPYLTSEFGNPSSLHAYGQTARTAVRTARRQTAASLGAKAQDIVFTGGGTEANNLAILGYLRANCPHGGHIVTTAVEHASVLRIFESLAGRGYDVTFLPVGEDGRVNMEEVRRSLRDDTVLVSVMAANNETGMIQPLAEIGVLAREKNAAFHVDAVQGFGWLPLRPEEQHIDLLSIAGHKVYGPKGIGALYIRSGIKIRPDTFGGPQERKLRAGTENVAAIAGFGRACELLRDEWRERACKVRTLKEFFYNILIKGNGRYRLNGTMAHSLPNIINVSVAHVDRTIVLIALDRRGIAVSAGSACEAGAAQPSHVLQAMGVTGDWLSGSVRVSFGKDTTKEDLVKTIKEIRKIAGEERADG